jgi:anaerobic nitric oxide reductase flavorubredoxin
MKTQVKNNVYWLGKTDWGLVKFHGDEYSIDKGTTYNAYLIKEEKTALIDTVWRPFTQEFITNLAGETDIKKIDYVIINHGEIDHSGAMPELMDIIPDVPVYCTENCVKSMKGHYQKDWNFVTVKTGDRLSLGSKELIFIEAPMLHWPDTMFTYLTGDNILFSNDAFGQHYCSEYLFSDLVDQGELYYQAMKYYANILTPFSHLVTKKVNEFLALGLPLDIICTSHGMSWRKDPMQIIRTYLGWADNYQENQITVIYDSMWDSTRRMAETIAKGIVATDDRVNVKVMCSSKHDKNDIITEVFKSKTIAVGSPTINNGILYSVAGILEMIQGMKFKKKKAAAFGSYGWHCSSVEMINKHLGASGFEIIAEPLKIRWQPDEQAISDCFEFGKMLASK